MSQVKIQGNASGTGIFTVAAPNSNTDITLTLPDVAGTLVVSGSTPSFNGIQFPTTQVPSADANTLDDYEEGTWTPTAWGGGNITSANGRYIKIGKMVYVGWDIQYGSTGNGDAAGFKGLPFTVNSNGAAQGCTVTSYSTYGSGYQALVISNAVRVIFYNLSGVTLYNNNFSTVRAMGGAIYEVA